jgi:hypothetical protein
LQLEKVLGNKTTAKKFLREGKRTKKNVFLRSKRIFLVLKKTKMGFLGEINSLSLAKILDPKISRSLKSVQRYLIREVTHKILGDLSGLTCKQKGRKTVEAVRTLFNTNFI